MYKVYNTKFLTNKQRFNQGLLFGTLTSIGCAILYAVFINVFHISLSLLYVAMGYAISMSIQKFGRGVQPKFSVLGAVLTVISFILAMILVYNPFGFEIILHPEYWGQTFQNILGIYQHMNSSTLLMIAFQAFGVYIAYVNSRVV